jgi:DNA-binding PadR family transcriptional regulator
MFRMRMGRGFFGPGGPFGPEGFLGENRRFFGRGDLKFALLELLQERPMHGYEMMKALEERSGGFYVASAGSIYPTLQLLEDRGLVSLTQAEGKKVYNITDTGRAFLGEHHKEEEQTSPWHGFGPGKRWNNPEIQALRSEAMEVTRLFVIAGRSAFNEPAKLARLRSILERVHKELSDLIYSGSGEKSEPTPPSSEQTPPPTSEQA